MNILKSVKKIPGGLMVVPLLLGAIINTFFGGTIWTRCNADPGSVHFL